MADKVGLPRQVLPESALGGPWRGWDRLSRRYAQVPGSRANKGRFRKILARKPYLPGHRPVLYRRAGVPTGQILCPPRLNSPRLAATSPDLGAWAAVRRRVAPAHGRSRPRCVTPPTTSPSPTGASCRARARRRRRAGTGNRWRRSANRRPRRRRRRAAAAGAPTRPRGFSPARRAVARRRQHAGAHRRAHSRLDEL